jgi:hypothetical protein
VSALLLNAFKALGSAATRHEIGVVADALRRSGDEEVRGLLDYSQGNQEAWRRCLAIADDAGAFGFVALDLALAFQRPEAFHGLEDHEDIDELV